VCEGRVSSAVGQERVCPHRRAGLFIQSSYSSVQYICLCVCVCVCVCVRVCACVCVCFMVSTPLSALLKNDCREAWVDHGKKKKREVFLHIVATSQGDS